MNKQMFCLTICKQTVNHFTIGSFKEGVNFCNPLFGSNCFSFVLARPHLWKASLARVNEKVVIFCKFFSSQGFVEVRRSSALTQFLHPTKISKGRPYLTSRNFRQIAWEPPSSSPW